MGSCVTKEATLDTNLATEITQSDNLINDTHQTQAITNDIKEQHDNDHKKIICICGAQCVEKIAQECYESASGLHCDKCLQNVFSTDTVYHCPQKRNNLHPAGYDLCINCALNIHQSSINQFCYCQTKLNTIVSPIGDSICRSCCNIIPSHDRIYSCLRSQRCFYRKISAQSYLICHKCYNSTDHEDEDNVTDRITFICNKFKATVEKIS